MGFDLDQAFLDRRRANPAILRRFSVSPNVRQGPTMPWHLRATNRKRRFAGAHGFAMGGGLTLAAACGIVLMKADAKWSLPEVPVGLFPAWG